MTNKPPAATPKPRKLRLNFPMMDAYEKLQAAGFSVSVYEGYPLVAMQLELTRAIKLLEMSRVDLWDLIPFEKGVLITTCGDLPVPLRTKRKPKWDSR